MTPVRTAARAMLAAIFVSSGADAVMNPDAKAARAKPVTDKVAPLIRRASPHLPTEAHTLVQVNGVVQVLAGALLPGGPGVCGTALIRLARFPWAP